MYKNIIIEIVFLLLVMIRGIRFIILSGKDINPNHIIWFPKISRPIYGKPPFNTDNNATIEDYPLLGIFLFFFDFIHYVLFDPVAYTIYLLYIFVLKIIKKQH